MLFGVVIVVYRPNELEDRHGVNEVNIVERDVLVILSRYVSVDESGYGVGMDYWKDSLLSYSLVGVKDKRTRAVRVLSS